MQITTLTIYGSYGQTSVNRGYHINFGFLQNMGIGTQTPTQIDKNNRGSY